MFHSSSSTITFTVHWNHPRVVPINVTSTILLYEKVSSSVWPFRCAIYSLVNLEIPSFSIWEIDEDVIFFVTLEIYYYEANGSFEHSAYYDSITHCESDILCALFVKTYLRLYHLHYRNLSTGTLGKSLHFV